MNNLKPYIQAYIKDWQSINEKENYKWTAVRHFQDTFFAKDIPFTERIAKALSKHVNLLDTRKYFPLGMLNVVSENKPLVAENIVNGLFDETQPLKDRIITYTSEFDKTIKIMAEERYSDWYGRDNVQSYQDVHAISVYLSMRYPERYYIYKYGVFREFSRIVGYKIQHSNAIDRYIEFNHVCNEVKKELLKDIVFISSYDSRMKDNGYDDSSYNLLTQDFIYSVATYLNHDVYIKADKKKPIEKDCIQIEAYELKTIEAKIPSSFKGVKDVDYAKKDKLTGNLGRQGEFWAITYEKERLSKLGISHKVIHTSVKEGDGKGYDIESVEEDGVTPRYIEVKTTTGSIKQPFYYSDNELRFSELHSKNYYIYRVYEFKDSSKQARVLIIHGSLKDLNGKPVSYKCKFRPIPVHLFRPYPFTRSIAGKINTFFLNSLLLA